MKNSIAIFLTPDQLMFVRDRLSQLFINDGHRGICSAAVSDPSNPEVCEACLRREEISRAFYLRQEPPKIALTSEWLTDRARRADEEDGEHTSE